MQGPCCRLQSKDLGYKFDGPVTTPHCDTVHVTHARTELSCDCSKLSQMSTGSKMLMKRAES